MGFGSGDLGMGITFSLQNNSAGPAAQIVNSMQSIENAAMKAGQSFTKSAHSITSGLIGVVTTAGTMLGPFLKGIDTANKFEKSLSAAYARGGADNLEQLDLLRQEALKISSDPTLKGTAQSIADTYIVLAQAGFKNMQILNQIRPVTLMAAAGDVTLAQAAEYASNAMHQFNMRSEDFGHISDVLVGGANESAQSLENLNQGLKYLAPTAKALNMSLEETVAYTQLAANAGMKGSIGTRAFSSALLNLTGASSKVADAMAAIGIDPFAGKNRSFIGLANMVKQLSSALSGMTQEERLKNIAIIFGKDASQEINTLLLKNLEIIQNGKKTYMSAAEALEYFTKKNLNSAGVAARTSQIMLDNAQGWVDNVKEMFKTTLINIGETFQESIKMIGPYIMKLLTFINKIIKSPFGQWLLKIGFVIGLVTTALVALNFIVSILIPAIFNMAKGAVLLVIEFAPLIALLAAIGYSIYKVITAMETFDQVTLNAAGNLERPLTAWEKMAGVMAGMGEIWKSWNGKTFQLSAGLHDKLEAAGILDETLNIGTYLVRAQEFTNGFLEGFKTSEWSQVGDAILAVADAIKDILLQLGLGPASGTTAWWKQLGKDLSGVFNGSLISTLKGVAAVFENLFHGISLLIATLVEFKRNGIYNMDTKEWFNWDRVFNNAFNGGNTKKTGKGHRITTPSEFDANKFAMDNFNNPKSIGQIMAESNAAAMKRPAGTTSSSSGVVIPTIQTDVFLDHEKIGRILTQGSRDEFERSQGN